MRIYQSGVVAPAHLSLPLWNRVGPPTGPHLSPKVATSQTIELSALILTTSVFQLASGSAVSKKHRKVYSRILLERRLLSTHWAVPLRRTVMNQSERATQRQRDGGQKFRSQHLDSNLRRLIHPLQTISPSTPTLCTLQSWWLLRTVLLMDSQSCSLIRPSRSSMVYNR